MPDFSPSIEINLDHLLHNLEQIRSVLPHETGIMPVVKDSAYGCGATVIARFLESDGGIDRFAVARIEEALTLRDSGISGSILVLGSVEDNALEKGIESAVTFTCNGLDDLYRWKHSGVPVAFHCNIDTGMRRLGIQLDELELFIELLGGSPLLRCTGCYTHMASADVKGTATITEQHARFTGAIARLKKAGIVPGCIHVANSATIFRHPLPGCTHVRPGISLYGCLPDPAQDFGVPLQPVLSLKATVVALRNVPAGTAVSYGGHYVTDRETTIATVGAGYAHGVPRYLSSRGAVLIGGKRYTIAGNVTMDYVMADVGPDPECAIGDEAVIIGSQGDQRITPDEIAVTGSTIGYEVLCNMGRAVPRTYIRNGAVVATRECHSF